MNYDLAPLLNEFSYNPEKVTARIIPGDDGTQKIQMRIDLGLLQMEPTGRPDGTSPRGCDSLLQHYLRLQTTEKPGSWKLSPNDCAELQQEAVQYYYRYLSCFALSRYEQVVSDTTHNHTLIELVATHAENDELAWEFLQYKPYVIMMNTRARVELSLQNGDYPTAEAETREGLKKIKAFWEKESDSSWADDCPESMTLRQLLKKLEKRETPDRSEIDQLRKALDKAVQTEDFEGAAEIRDQLMALEQRHP